MKKLGDYRAAVQRGVNLTRAGRREPARRRDVGLDLPPGLVEGIQTRL